MYIPVPAYVCSSSVAELVLHLAVAWPGYSTWLWHGLGTALGCGMAWVQHLAVAWPGYSTHKLMYICNFVRSLQT